MDSCTADASPSSELSTDQIARLRGQKDWTAEMVIEQGSIRDTSPLTSDQSLVVNELIDAIDAAPKYCFENSRRAAFHHEDAVYTEGYVFLSDYDLAIEHAWVELDGRVAELTFKERPDVPEDSVYLGVSYEEDTVRDVLSERTYGCTVSHWLKRQEAEAE